MPKLSVDTLLARAIPRAMKDRESFVDCHGGVGEWADEAREIIACIKALSGRKFSTLNVDEMESARLAFYYAEQWERSIADSMSNCSKSASTDNLRLSRLFKEVRLKHWGRTVGEAMLDNAAVVVIPINSPGV